MARPGFGGHTIKLAHHDQGVNGGSAFAARVSAGEQIVEATDVTPRRERSVAELPISIMPSSQ